ncbi:hypothetical protein ACOMHN_048199 [Nucella lapillus]
MESASSTEENGITLTTSHGPCGHPYPATVSFSGGCDCTCSIPYRLQHHEGAGEQQDEGSPSCNGAQLHQR